MPNPEPADRPAATTPSAAPTPETPSASAERRKNPHLRELIDEMMATIRVAVNRDLWTPEERSKAETDLAEIMTRVRSQALRRVH